MLSHHWDTSWGVKRMKITDNTGYLELKRTDDPEFPYLRIAATIQTSSGNFVGENSGVMYGGGEAGKEQLQRFRSFKANEVRVELTEGCGLIVRRLPRGNMEVQFVIAVSGNGSETSMKGLVTVEGEYAWQFVEELWSEIA